MNANENRTRKVGWPRSVFAHIEAGSRHPRLGMLIGYAGLLVGLLPSGTILWLALFSISVKQILDPGLAVLDSIGWSVMAMGLCAMLYKFAHELGGPAASAAAFLGFCLAPLSVPIAFLYVIVARVLNFEVMMP